MNTKCFHFILLSLKTKQNYGIGEEKLRKLTHLYMIHLCTHSSIRKCSCKSWNSVLRWIYIADRFYITVVQG